MINRFTLRNHRRAALHFILAIFAVPAFLAACDGGNSAVQETVTPLERGQAVFARNCNACHPGGRAGSGPALTTLAPRLSDDQIRQVVRSGKNRMPGFTASDISDADLEGIILYVRSMK